MNRERKMEKENISPEISEAENAIATVTEPMEPDAGSGCGEEIEEEMEEEQPEENTSDRNGKIELLFGNYPLTHSLLSESEGFIVDDRTERFMASVEGYLRGSGKKGEEIDESLQMLFSIGIAVSNGEMTLDMLDTIIKGISHDRLVAEATKEAELKGKNSKIEIQMRNRTGGDGVPHPGSRGGSQQNRSRGIFSLAAEAKR